MPAATRITICPIEATNNYGELTRFEVDTATTSLREVADRINADPMLRDGTQLLTYEGGVAGDPIDMLNPSVAMGPLATIVPLIAACFGEWPHRVRRGPRAVARRRRVRDGQ